jgi:hypothetical protein
MSLVYRFPTHFLVCNDNINQYVYYHFITAHIHYIVSIAICGV